MENLTNVIDAANLIADFLSRRDLDVLSRDDLQNKFGQSKADLFILLGNSDVQSVSLAGQVMVDQLTDNLLICGGIGHSTSFLVANLFRDAALTDIPTVEQSEAEMLYEVLKKDFAPDLAKVFLETTSTNCGANAREALRVVKENALEHTLVILVQDATMQLRTVASFQKEWASENTTFINFASRKPRLVLKNDQLQLDMADPPWTVERFLSLITGEIPRLRDDTTGYGPKGKGFISHVEIPFEIERDYQRIKKVYDSNRKPNI